MNNLGPNRKHRRRLKFAGQDIVDDIRSKYGFEGELAHLFARGSERLIHKWHHFIDRYFLRFRGTRVRFLEIGVSQGGSLDLWRSYFGDAATIFGTDIEPECAQFDGISGSVRIGSQTDPAFLDGVVSELSGIDVVLDDGSHKMDHIRSSLSHFFPKLARRGTYMIEDLHTAYYANFGGGFRSEENFFNELRRYADVLHRHYHDGDVVPEFARDIFGVHVHDSIIVLDKDPVHAPCRSRVVRREGVSSLDIVVPLLRNTIYLVGRAIGLSRSNLRAGFGVLGLLALTGCGGFDSLAGSSGLDSLGGSSGFGGAGSGSPSAPLEFRARLQRGEDRRDFTVRARAGGATLDQVRESVRFQATRYCLPTFGGSEAEWTIDPVTGDWAFTRDGADLIFSGRCTAR